MPDTSQEWRAGRVDRWSKAMARWIVGVGRVTIRPGHSVKEIEDELAKDHGAPIRVTVAPF